MAEYYAIERSGKRLEHDAAPLPKGGTYKNAKYLARIKRPSGRYRYIYELAELSAYKDGSGASNNTTSIGNNAKKKPKKVDYSRLSKPVTGMSAGSLVYKGESDTTTAAELASDPREVNTASVKKKKKKSKKSRTSYIIANINRR